MSFSIQALHASLLEGVRAELAPLVAELRGASAVLPVLVGTEHRRLAAIRERLGQVECEIEETLSRRNTNARRLDSLVHPPKLAEPVASNVAFPFAGKWGRP